MVEMLIQMKKKKKFTFSMAHRYRIWLVNLELSNVNAALRNCIGYSKIKLLRMNSLHHKLLHTFMVKKVSACKVEAALNVHA